MLFKLTYRPIWIEAQSLKEAELWVYDNDGAVLFRTAPDKLIPEIDPPDPRAAFTVPPDYSTS